MRISKLLLVLLLCVVFSTGCSSSKPEKDMGEIYSLSLDAFMPVDEGLNGGMKYIAIDMSNFKDLTGTDKKQILTYFQKYKVDVMEASFEELKAKGLYNEKTMVLDGVLLSVQQIEILNSKVVIEGSKYRAGDGAIGMKVVVEYKEGKWQVSKAGSTWIS